MTDIELLHEYASRSSDQAFGTLVERYAGLVYSAALRQTRNPPEAEEITQVVFIIFARKAAGMGKNVILPGWLLRTTRFVALNAIRREMHRRHTEQQAVSLFQTDSDVAWNRIAPILDEALVSLGEKDRNAVALRFLERRSFKEIAELLRTSEDGAQKRVTRALGKLRTYFIKNGVVLSTTVVATVLTAKTVQAVPAGLPAIIAAGVVSSASIPPLGSTAMAALQRTQLKSLALKLSSVVVLLILALLALREFNTERPAPPTLPNSAPSSPLSANSPPPTFPPDLASPPNPGQILLRVLDSRTDSPLRNAKVTVIWGAGFPDTMTNLLSTDRRGESLVSFPPASDERWRLRFEIIKDGYVPKFVSWAAERGDLLEDIPAQYVTKLALATDVAGLVMNEDSEPVSDVQVVVDGPGPGTGPEPPAEREGVAIAHTETTDAQGRWLCNHVPPQLQLVTFSFSHSEYLTATFKPAKLGTAAQSPLNTVAEDDLRYGSAFIVLRRGRVATGVVRDEQGQPINGARVTRDRLYWYGPATTLTAADGGFKFGNIPPGEQLILTAHADGFLPEDITLSQDASSEGLQLILRKAAVLRGHVLDPEAHPIARASVLPVSGDYGADRFNWSTLTDAQGRFEWLSAPTLPVRYQISASGYRYLRVDLPADGVEQTITLEKALRSPPVRIAGRVTDSLSHQPIADFQVWTAVTLRRGSSSGFPTYMGLGRKLITIGQNGHFAFLAPIHYADPIEKVDIEIRAEGYLTAQQSLAGPLTNSSQQELELTAVGGFTGAVQLPNGAPVSGAMIIACAPNSDLSQPYGAEPRVYVSLPGEFDLRHSSQNRSETDAQGTFTLKTKPLTGMIFAAHKLGYAAAPLDRLSPSSVIKLNPWGSVSGTLKVGKALGTNRTVFLGNFPGDRPQFVSLALTAVTDDFGHFTIEGVPPGEWRLLPHGIGIKVKAGERTEVVVGGGGLRIVGKINPADANHGLNEEGYNLVLSSRLLDRATPTSRQFRSVHDYLAAKVEWSKAKLAYLQTEAGRQALRTDYIPVTQPDGTFIIDEVLPGNYELRLSLEPNPLKLNPLMSVLDDVIQEVVVPTEATSDTLDLGIVDLHLAAPRGSRW